MSAAERSGTPMPMSPLRAELAAYFVRRDRPKDAQRDCRHGILRELAELGLIR